MLDKSLEYYRVIMKREPGTPIPAAELPEGFFFSMYREGDELAWAEIEASVQEFDDVEEAATYFHENYVPYATEVVRRTLFIQREDGKKVATFTAWWNYTGRRRHPFMHWVAVKPSYQGLGLGKAIIARGVKLMTELEGDCTMYIPTQTWSHKAIRLYRWAGFELELNEPEPGGVINQTKQALALIKHLI
ncbi:GNAT family N-acetyltransferase [Paenibacillus ginsengarvi]|uniref:GNAT family N-acetyltransferase n=1 Tax=Paenibacillus ginsengarvi TaxID=400777 RepID=A0A3B0BKD7_9BACL|nr:GNAT family N-acetyltransferase [Paenibacillus ginsengarvi]RKN72992.1 GNAT family N-acetyltransferase [Paenibacillus ginsengarvi]